MAPSSRHYHPKHARIVSIQLFRILQNGCLSFIGWCRATTLDHHLLKVHRCLQGCNMKISHGTKAPSPKDEDVAVFVKHSRRSFSGPEVGPWKRHLAPLHIVAEPALNQLSVQPLRSLVGAALEAPTFAGEFLRQTLAERLWKDCGKTS